jgi:hypothetical protein
VPGLNAVQGLHQAVTGCDAFTGQTLNPLQRGLGLLAAAGPLLHGAGALAGAVGGRVGGIEAVVKGQSGVARAIADIQSAGGRILGEEVTIETSAARTRPDLFVEAANGNRFFLEVKNGPFASLTRNQRAAYPLIRTEGGVSRAIGNRFLPYGDVVPPTPVYIIKY